jgi:hypothetical protein
MKSAKARQRRKLICQKCGQPKSDRSTDVPVVSAQDPGVTPLPG